MKHIYTLLTALALATGLQAQTTALDFTADDCAGTNHNLFTELDAGDVVILELVMMGCQPCVTAGNSLKNAVLPNVSDPDRVKLYSIGFTNSINCTQMNDWKNTNGFTHTVFAGMSAQTTHYGGMGMPTIAVVGGGSAHTVYFSQQGHNASDNPTILAAIEDALSASVNVSEEAMDNVGVSPNPVIDMLAIEGAHWNRACVLDIQGREQLAVPLNGGKLDVSSLATGAYVLHLSDASGAMGTARFEKR
ncbi:MAG: T9SS type A sorting domain-containing protein [Flavobacteriales bacterium]|nr:T9SS type A sorting domain-containing protein [Flavobacteriales bacterium]